MKVGDQYIGESVIGSRFHCSIDSVTRVGEKNAVFPLISGQAWITGTHQYLLDPSDPWPYGYKVADTWPEIG